VPVLTGGESLLHNLYVLQSGVSNWGHSQVQ